jgi:hypothetical protein
MILTPESSFVVEVTAYDEIVCKPPTGTEQRIKVANLGSVLFETADDALFGIDWWLLNNRKGELAVAFPLGATGEQAALDRLRALPEFKMDGMNSTGSGHFLCWKSPS